MLIIQEAEKDTYVNSRNLKISNLNKSNVGLASTLDLFKLNNENKSVFSEGYLKFINPPTANESIEIKDSSNNSVKIVFKNIDFDSINIGKTVDNSTDDIHMGMNGLSITQIAENFSKLINNITSFTQTGPSGNQTLNITSFYNSLGEVILRQKKAGISGDTEILTDIPLNNLKKLNFRRIEKSAILIKFDLEKLKKLYVYDSNDDDLRDGYSNSIFNTTNFEAKVVLKDVNTGHSKPFDYTLKLVPINKKFEEGRGKDTIHFSDIDNANFINLNSTENWKIPGFISYHNSDDVILGDDNLYVKEFKVSKGNEDIEFDITDWIKHVFSSSDGVDFGFIIDFKEDILQDSNSYFVKRLGSRHLLNKKLVPKLEIKLKDEEINLKTNINKKRYLNNNEVFYLKNVVNGSETNIIGPAGYDLTFNIEYEKNNDCKARGEITVTGIPEDGSSFTLKDTNGNISIFQFDSSSNQSDLGSTVLGSSNIKVGTSGLNTNDEVANHIKGVINAINTYTQVKSDDLSNDNNQKLNISASIDTSNNANIILRQHIAGLLGDTEILKSGTDLLTLNDFERFTYNSKIDIDNNNDYKVNNFKGQELVGLKKVEVTNLDIDRYNEFLKEEINENGYATFNITWKWHLLGEFIEDFVIKKETVKFYIPESSNLNFNIKRKIRTSILIKDNELLADDNIHNIEVMFYDIEKQYKTAKLPYELPCLNLGNVYYEVLDEYNNIIIKGDKDYTKLSWNGKNYEFDLYVPEMFKNNIITFKFYLENDIHKTTKTINKSEIKIKVL